MDGRPPAGILAGIGFDATRQGAVRLPKLGVLGNQCSATHGTRRPVGQMANEVQEKCPDAVSYRLDGIFVVDDGRLLH